MNRKYLASLLLFLLLVFGAGEASAKSMYVISSINSNPTPIQAYDIQGNNIVYQATYGVPYYAGGAVGLAIDTDSKFLFVTYEGSNFISLINATTMTSQGTTTAPGASNLAGIVVDQNKQKVYTVDRNTNKLYVYSWNPVTKTLTLDGGTYKPLPGVSEAHGIALDEVNDLLYVGDLTTTVKIFNTSDWSSAGSFPVSQQVMGIAIDVINKLVYTGNAYPGYGSIGRLIKYDLNTNTETYITLPGDNVVGLSVDPATSLLYITTGNQGYGGSDKLIVYNSDLQLLSQTGDIGDPTGVVVPGKEISYNPLNLVKSDGLSTCVNSGNPVTYTISYTNTNSYQVTGVTIKDTLPAETIFVSASNGGTLVGNTVMWNISTVPAGASGSVTLVVQVNAGTPPGTTITNSATIDSDQTPPTTQSDTTDTCSNQPPVAEAGGPYTGSEGTPITFDASASSDPDGNTLQYRWDFNNDGTWDTVWSGSPTATNVWNDDFSGTVNVEVSDGTLTDNDSISVTVSNVAPTVNAGAGQTANEGDTVSFSGSFTDPGILDTHTIAWDFGDGSTDSGTLTPAHIYADNGVYTVTLTVADDDGASTSDTLAVTVNNVAPTVTMDSSYYVPASVTLRIAGQGKVGNSVALEIIQEGNVLASDKITRTPGSPNEQEVTISATIDMSKSYSGRLIFDTETAYSGGTPVWIIIESVKTKVTTFNTQKSDPSSYHQIYDFALPGLVSVVGKEISFTGSATDPGADDLTFDWLFGDGGSASKLYPWNNVHSVAETVKHTYSAAGSYTVTLNVTDDDGGVGSALKTIVIS